MPLVQLKAVDNTFFRKGDPFDTTVNNHIESMDTPYNSTIFGAIFTALLTENDNFRNEFFNKGKYDHKKILSIKNVFLYDNKRLYIKAPLDLFINEDKRVGKVKKGKFERLNIKSNFSNFAFKYLLVAPKGDYERVDDYYISVNDFLRKYKRRTLPNIILKSRDEIFVKNDKVGIKLNKEIGTVEESHLYSIEQTEFKDKKWSYVVEYEINSEKERQYKSEIRPLEEGYLKLGGENKVCRYKTLAEENVYKFKDFKEGDFKIKDDLIKVLFLQEVYFEENIKEVFSENDSLEIVGLSNSKAIYIGGYDMKDSQAKIMYKGYSAGTILLLKINQQKIEEKINEEKINKKDVIKELLDDSLKARDKSGAGKYIII
ncbi:hypothetical protein U472_10880 [Orenia metallireducens]|uniref:CRISPR-associated protein Cmr3 n=1 Tax=Orenia metallireducens TaxID=1413210 RepID=A0A1C0A8A4_9FIRM|nr:type III-B CRISPR module-associated Cmr3 family protein [Orenia metallireducens]OCL26493.1 hypothetical protein U472_10880 [Orenia metallireducens]